MSHVIRETVTTKEFLIIVVSRVSRPFSVWDQLFERLTES